MAITDIEVMQHYIRMCGDGWDQGWHERNGGNLTYRMRPEEVEQCRPYFKAIPGQWVNMGVQADNLRQRQVFPQRAPGPPGQHLHCGD